ncbi:hypothetical protein CIRMBP1270_02164 [Enterococcus cecorum]|uniref:hypothetical protein n=1 Tax=Enterococcus cecorum TaxID=44008 RepID=UPI0022D2542A|nr:hypothetical protein CIRMBP1220_00783 [Enterococcus cecorum]CAI3424019.1 hypothetical protein CIRMBP1243_01967 [Enterococcus cecorum]CAI3429006.1 hypothetical protein CIRMBP1251_01747 [Enterococcus cecorum]CAI3430397.1 hypothetical protein CIRMBP1245_01895 [Enterococcus cecorum]CAI3441712.1 hypothetical protein CIRMBP1263_01919 [Enterococcus cecorum]
MKKYILMSENRTNSFVRAVYGSFVWRTRFINHAKLFAAKYEVNVLAKKHDFRILEVTEESDEEG